MDRVCNFSLEEAVVKEVWRRKRCVWAEEERCLVAKTNPAVLSSCSHSELPSQARKNDWFCSQSGWTVLLHGYSHCAQGTSVCSHATIMLTSHNQGFVSDSLLVEGCYGLMFSLCVCVCLFFSSTGAIQWNPDFLCHNSFRGSSGSQPVLNNTSLLYEHSRFIPLSRLFYLFSFSIFIIENKMICCRLLLFEKHFVNVGGSAFTVHCF